MKSLVVQVGGLVIGAAAVLAATGRTAFAQAPAQGQAGLRVANMSPGAPPQVDVFVDGQRVLGPVAYQQATQTQNVPPGSHEVKVTAAGQTDPAVLTTRVDMAANKTYTIGVTGTAGDVKPVTLEDDLTPAPEGRGRLRFVNAIPNTKVNVIANTGETLFQNVDYRATTDFKEVPAATYSLDVRDATTNASLTTVSNVVVPSRGSAAAFATGSAQFGGAPVQQQPPAPTPTRSVPATGTGGLVGTETSERPLLLASSALLVALLGLTLMGFHRAAQRGHDR